MNEQGCSELPADANGRILDRLVCLEKIISAEQICMAITATGRRNKTGCGLPQNDPQRTMKFTG